MGAGIGPALPPSYAARPRVDALLDSVTQRRIAVLVAPAGSGKKVAVAGWAAARPALNVRWLDAAEPPGVAQRSPSPFPPTPAGTVLVLDGAGLAPADATMLLAGLHRSEAEVPRLLVIAREEPPWVPTRLRLEGQVGIVRYADLRFRRGEARDLVRAHRAALTEFQANHIVELGRGWAAALVLLADAPPPDVPTPSDVSSTPLPLVDYVAEEVLLPLTPAMRKALASVCDEPYVDAEEATVLSGDRDAPRLLADAATEGFLVEPAVVVRDGTEQPVWRLHPLLLDVLRRRCGPDGPERRTVVRAHTRAAEHYGRLGDTELALRHAMLTGALGLQVNALSMYAMELMARGRASQVAHALELIPAALRQRFRQTGALDAIVLRGLGRYDEAKSAADRALAAADTMAQSGSPSPGRRDLEADLAILDVWQARCGWRRPSAARARAAALLGCRHHSDRGEPALDESHETSGITPLRSSWLMLDLAALELWHDDLEGAGIHIAAAEAYGREADMPRILCSALSLRAVLHMAQGSNQTAANTADSALEVLADHDLEAFTAAARAHVVRGLSRFNALELVGAAEDLAAIEGTSPDPFTPTVPVYRRLLAANLMTVSGDAPAAQQLLAAEDTPARLPRYARRHLSVARLRAAAWMGDVAGVEAEARVLRDEGWRIEADYAHGLALGLNGRIDDALRWFDRMLGADGAGDPGGGAEVATGAARGAAAAAAVARVALLLRTGATEDVNRARHLLPDALSRLAPQRLLLLVAGGQLVSARFCDLLDEEASRAGGHPLAGAVLEALRGQQGAHLSIGTAAWVASDAHGKAAVVGLTPRELDVLRALANGGSNAAVASSLYLSENTVKTHLASLYRKLDVDSRTRAVAAGRELGLL